MKSTINVDLPMPVSLPSGDEANEAVIKMLTVKERRDLRKKYGNDPEGFANDSLIARLMRLGDLSAPIPREVFDVLPAPVYDELQEATLAQDFGFDSLEDFRKSERYDGFRV